MKKFGFIVLIFFAACMDGHDPLHDPVTIDIYYYSSKETLRRIITTIHNRHKGVYFRFSDEDAAVALGQENHANLQQYRHELSNAFRLDGDTVFRSFSYACKGMDVNLTSNVDLTQMITTCKAQARRFAPLWGGQLRKLYDYDALTSLASNHHDMHYLFRFLQRIKDAPQVIFIGDESITMKTRQLFFGRSHIFIPVSNESVADLNAIEQACLHQMQNGKYTIVAHAIGVAGNVVAHRLWQRSNSVFLLSVGSLIDIANGTAQDKRINVDQLRSMLSREIKFFCTAALLRDKAAIRQQEYMRSITILHEYWYDPYIVEATQQIPSFFESHCRNVFHSTVNNASIQNKGVNEGRSMLQGLHHFQFHDDDLLIKLTARYHFKSDTFLRIIEDTPEYDGYVTLDPRKFFSFSGCFGLKAKYLKEMLATNDFVRMSREPIYMESVVLDFMKKIEKERGAKIMYLDEVDVKAHVGHYLDYDW